MVPADRMPFLLRWSAEIVGKAMSLGRLEFTVRPSKGVDKKDIKSLRSAAYFFSCFGTSEWLDIEELTVVIDAVLQARSVLHSGKATLSQRGINITTTVNSAPSDEFILATVEKTLFLAAASVPDHLPS